MKLEAIEKQIERYTYMRESFIRHMKIKETDNFKTIICKMYLNIESVTKIAKWANEQGYRIPSQKGERKYGVNDISAILNSNDSDVDKELRYIVHQLFKANKAGSKIKEWEDKCRG